MSHDNHDSHDSQSSQSSGDQPQPAADAPAMGGENGPALPTGLQMQTIGIVHSCYKEKFGIPRQPGLAQSATAVLELVGDCASMDAVRGLQGCSHVWVLFLFSEHLHRGWTPLVRPPRSKGGKMGVFATRSTFRPNPIGMSVVRLERIEVRRGKPLLHLRGADILDGTPVIDIKPYLPYADSVPEASNSYAPDGQLLELAVEFSAAALSRLQQHPDAEGLERLITEVLRCDPRPTQHRGKRADHHSGEDKGGTRARSYGTLLDNVNVRWRITDRAIEVLAIEVLSTDVRASEQVSIEADSNH